MTRNKLLAGAMLALSFALAAGCTDVPGVNKSPQAVQAARGAVQVTLQGDITRLRGAQATVDDIDHLTISLQTTEGTQSKSLTKAQLASATASVTFNELLPGSATASVDVFDAPGRTIGHASATTTIVAQQTTNVALGVTLDGDVAFDPNPSPPPPTNLAANLTINDGANTTLTGELDGNFAKLATDSVSLRSPRFGGVSVVTNGYVYLLGGIVSGNVKTASVERASYALDGTLSDFATASTLVTARYFHAGLNAGNHVYVSGGYTDSGETASVERAAVNADGTLGAFVTENESLVTARREHAMVRIGDYLYVVGGNNGSILGTLERAAINADGTLGAFATVDGITLNVPRSKHSCLVTPSYLYVFGGTTDQSYSGGTSVVERAPINNDGTIGAFTSLGNVTLASKRCGGTAIRAGQYVYLIGGESLTTGNPYSNAIDRATLYSDGTIGNFEATASVIAEKRGSAGGVQVGKYLYLLGGYNGAYLDTVERASLLLP